MVFTHDVKHNGVYYKAGMDVPIEEANGGSTAPVVDSGKVDKKYTEKDLEGLKYFALKSLAVKEGFTVDKKAKFEDIKKMLLTKELV